MDLSFLMDYVNLVTLGICLCVGFALKYAKLFEWLGNQYIPLAMLILGTAINLMINWPDVEAQVILGGMISGLASTGFYEMLRNMLQKDGKREEKGE
ncbi:MAG TPA: phage holin family protein [Candidatus Blautia excrementipullorum]|nr:phage holin family protein [Candidatus Blautia excrementipullorum]